MTSLILRYYIWMLAWENLLKSNYNQRNPNTEALIGLSKKYKNVIYENNKDYWIYEQRKLLRLREKITDPFLDDLWKDIYEFTVKRMKYFTFKSAPSRKENSRIDLDMLKKIPINRFIPYEGQKTGNKIIFNCPLHGEKTPSFVWYCKNNSFYCFGCQKGGSVIDFYMQYFNQDFKTTIKELQKYEI